MILKPRQRRPCNVSSLDEVDEKFQNSRFRDAKRKREKAKWARQVAARIPPEPATNNLSEGERNIIMYKNWSLRKKVKFAQQGYCFTNDKTKPVIRYFTTSLKTVRGMSRGVQATNVLPYLPIGFLIMFSWSTREPEFTTEGIQQYYQVGIGNSVYMVHPEPCTAYGMANFVNCAIESSHTGTRKYRNSLRRITGQEMHIPNVHLTVANWVNGKIMKTRFPFYYSVIKEVKPWEELLMLPKYGGDHNYPVDDIVR